MNIKYIDKMISKKTIPIIQYNKIENNYAFSRNLNKNIINIDFLKENKNIKKEFKYYLYNFTTKMNHYLTHCNFENFKKNINTLKIIEKISNDSSAYACYYARSNKILLFTDDISTNLNHELLHMSSSKKINDNLYLIGFSIYDYSKQKYYGLFINEGYTEYLKSKYFCEANGYTGIIEYIKLLENIIEKKLLEEMYFNADIKGLINELMKYNTKKEVLEFILNTDIIYNYIYTSKPTNKLKLIQATIKTNIFLIKTYYNKLLEEGLEYNELSNKFNSYIKKLKKVSFNYKSTHIFTKETGKHYIKKLNKRSYYF